MEKGVRKSSGTPPAKRARVEHSQDKIVEEVIENNGPQNIPRSPPKALSVCIDLDAEPNVIQNAPKERKRNRNRKQEEDTSPKALFECASITIYQKYNRLDKLVSDIVDAVKDSIDNKVEGELPGNISDNWCSKFQNYMVILPFSQVQIIFNGLLNIIEADCILPLEKDPEDTRSLKILSISSQLLRIFLGGVHIADHTVHTHRVVQFMKHMKKLHNHLGRLGSALLQKQYDHALMHSFLELCLAWGDLHILLITYRPIGEIVELPKLYEPDTTPTNLFALHPYLANDQWSLIAQRITNFGEGSCKQLLDKLILQKLSAMSMFDAAACKDSSTAAAKSLALSLENDLIPTIGNNGLLITDSLDNKQTLALAARIIQHLQTAETWPQNELEMQGFQENRPLILGLLVQTVNEISKIFGSNRDKANPLPQLTKNVAGYFSPSTVEKTDMKFHSTDTILSAIVNDICHCIEEGLGNNASLLSNTAKTKVDYRSLDCSLRILATLPLENLNENIQTITLSFCLALIISLEATCPDDEAWNKLSTEQKVQDLILRLLDGRNAPNISRYVKVGPFLRWLSQAKIERNEAHCRKLLELLFGKSLMDLRYLESLELGVPLLLRDGDKEAETTNIVHFETAIILLQTINKSTKSNKKIQYRCCQMQKRLGSRLMRFARQLMLLESESLREDLLFDAFSATIVGYQESQDAGVLNAISEGLKEVLGKMFDKVKEREASSLTLLSIILGNEAVLKHLPDNFLLTAWEATLSLENVSEQQTKLIESMDWEQYKKAIDTLMAEMEIAFSKSVSPLLVEKYAKLWMSVVTARYNNYKCLYLLKSLTKLTDILLTASLLGHITNIRPILEFNIAAVNQREERVSKVLIDFYLESITVIPLPDMRSIQLGLKLLTDILHKCPGIATGLMPALLQRFTHLMTLVAKAASTEYDDPLLEPCAFEIERLAGLIAKHGGFFCWGPYNIIADILQQFELYALRSDVKHHFMNAMRCFFEACDSHHILYLGKTLTPVSKMLFEAEYGSYIKHHRYVGKL